MTDLQEIAVGARTECPDCGETLVRKHKSDAVESADWDPLTDFVEVASGDPHQCWTQLPDNAEHLRLD